MDLPRAFGVPARALAKIDKKKLSKVDKKRLCTFTFEAGAQERCWHHKDGLTLWLILSINMEACAAATGHLPLGQKHWLLKRAPGWRGVGQCELIQGNQDRADCLLCGQAKSFGHVAEHQGTRSTSSFASSPDHDDKIRSFQADLCFGFSSALVMATASAESDRIFFSFDFPDCFNDWSFNFLSRHFPAALLEDADSRSRLCGSC